MVIVFNKGGLKALYNAGHRHLFRFICPMGRHVIVLASQKLERVLATFFWFK